MSIRSTVRKFLPLFVVLFFFAATANASFAYELLLGTAKVGSFSHFTGKTLCRIVNSSDTDISCRIAPQENYAANLTNLQNGALDLAIINTKLLHDAINSVGLFQFLDIQYDNLRLIMPLYRESVTLSVSKGSKIRTIDDLGGKKVNGGALFSMESILFKEIMRQKGWQKNFFALYQNLPATGGQDNIAFTTGNVQAKLHIGVHPDTFFIRDLANSGGTLVPVYDADILSLVESMKGLGIATISAQTYANIKEDMKTLAIESLLLASADTDREMILSVLTVLEENRQLIRKAHPSLLKDEVNLAILKKNFLSPHSAAIRYFEKKTATAQ